MSYVYKHYRSSYGNIAKIVITWNCVKYPLIIMSLIIDIILAGSCDVCVVSVRNSEVQCLQCETGYFWNAVSNACAGIICSSFVYHHVITSSNKRAVITLGTNTDTEEF